MCSGIKVLNNRLTKSWLLPAFRCTPRKFPATTAMWSFSSVPRSSTIRWEHKHTAKSLTQRRWPWRLAPADSRVTRFHILVLAFQLVPFDRRTSASYPQRLCLTLDQFAAQTIWSHKPSQTQACLFIQLLTLKLKLFLHFTNCVPFFEQIQFGDLAAALTARVKVADTGRWQLALYSRRRLFKKQTRWRRVAAE